MKKRLQALRNEEGLTLVELLAVIVILAIIAVVAFVMIGQVIENSKKDAHVANAQQMIASTKLFEAQGGDISSGEVTLATLNTGGHIDTIYDSWDKKAIPTDTTKVAKAADGKYTVTLTGNANGKCNISVVEATLVETGRGNCNDAP